MIHCLQPYPAYRDSGVPWVDSLPEHWEVWRNGRLFAKAGDTGFPELPILEVSLKTGVRVRDFEGSTRKQVMAEREKYQRARRGDLAYNMMRLWQGAVGVAPVDGLVSPAYVVARPLPGVESRYYEYLFRTGAYMGEVNQYSRGIVSDRNRLYWEQFKQMPSLVPPPDEQTAIVRFLDDADRKIRRYIRAKQKLIRLLEEQKQAIIHRAVTRGLDPDVRLKPSGVEWLGEVPEHWEVKKLRQCGSIVGGMTPSMEDRSFWDGNIPWVTPKDMKRFAIEDSIARVTTEALARTSLWKVPPCSVLLVVRGMILARRVPIAWTTAPVTINQDMKALVLAPQISGEYMAFMLHAAQEALLLLVDEAGHGTKRLPTERWRDLAVPGPPYAEQTAIACFLQTASASADAAINGAEREIALISEYRTRLIADVVSGKLDARAAAADLAGQVDDAEAEDEAELQGEDDPMEDELAAAFEGVEV